MDQILVKHRGYIDTCLRHVVEQTAKSDLRAMLESLREQLQDLQNCEPEFWTLDVSLSARENASDVNPGGPVLDNISYEAITFDDLDFDAKSSGSATPIEDIPSLVETLHAADRAARHDAFHQLLRGKLADTKRRQEPHF
ncbi:hypothetical protein ATCC90586_007221 [Pythium insidiosum]|nr:hypothetical protein ATCC90586_007221 [Pythium insidiosum]